LDTTSCPVIVVDNGSDDDTAAGMKKVVGRSSGRLEYIALEENLGAVARNVGVRCAVTRHVAFCDDDSSWDADAPSIAADILDSHPTVALLAARTLVGDSGRVDPVTALLAASPLGHDPALPGRSILGFLACSAVVRKAAFESVGGFSPILHFRGEETLLAWDLAAAGWDLCFCPNLTAHHRPSPMRQTTQEEHARIVRNATLTTWLRRPLPNCLRAAVRLVHNATDRPHRAALAEACAQLPAVIRERRRLPREVERQINLLGSDS
jgi:GT2 family glycosyltransferase